MAESRTREWLVEARQRAGLSQAELIEMVGLKSIIAISQYENGTRSPSQRTWDKLEQALKPFAPMMFVDVEGLIADAEAGMRWEKAGARCRLTYVAARDGLIFTGVLPDQGDELADPYVTVSFQDALALLEAQRDLLQNDRPEKPLDGLEADETGLRKAREGKGLSQRKAAALLGMPQSKLSLLESGKIKDPELASQCLKTLEGLSAEG